MSGLVERGLYCEPVLKVNRLLRKGVVVNCAYQFTIHITEGRVTYSDHHPQSLHGTVSPGGHSKRLSTADQGHKIHLDSRSN